MTVTIRKDKLPRLVRALNDLVGQRVLVGIPFENGERKDDPPGGEPMNSATLGYIHELGSPAQNIPPRPFLVPGIADAEDQIAKRLKAAATAALDGDQAKVQQQMSGAGSDAAASAKRKLSAGDFAPLKPSTVRDRMKGRKNSTMRDAERDYGEMIAAGADPQTAQDAAGIQPLINTGAMLQAITYKLTKAK